MTEIRRKKPVPFSFVLDLLAPANPYTKPMFGCTAVYVDDRIVLILRERDSFPEDNGVWLATSHEHHASLRVLFPNLRSLACFAHEGTTSWQALPASELDFEETATAACELILKGDPRIGKVPSGRKKAKRTPKDPAAKRKIAPTSGKKTTTQISRKLAAPSTTAKTAKAGMAKRGVKKHPVTGTKKRTAAPSRKTKRRR